MYLRNPVWLIPDQNEQNLYLFQTKTPKTLPVGVAHTFMAYI